MKKKFRWAWIISALTLSLIFCVGLLAYLIKQNIQFRNKHGKEKEIILGQKIYEARQSINHILKGIESHIEKHATLIGNKKLDNLPQNLESTLASLPYASAIGIAFAPYSYDTNTKLHSLYIQKHNKAFKSIDIQNYYNYLDTSWYKNSFGKKITWQEPFFEPSINADVLRLTTTIFKFDTKRNTSIPIAILFVDISQPELNDIANKTIYKPNTYAFLLSSKNNLISYPIADYLQKHKTLFSISQLSGKTDWRMISELIQRKEGGITTYTDTLTDESYWVLFEPLSFAKWKIVYVTLQENIFNEPFIQHNTMQCAATVCLMLIIFFFLLTSMGYMRYQKWLFATLVSLCCLILIILQLYLVSQMSPQSDKIIIKNQIDFARFKDFQQQRDRQLQKSVAHYVPTGIILNNILKTSENRLKLHGLIWQRYDATIDDIKPGISFINADDVEFVELYRTKQEDATVIGWRFRMISDTVFDQSKYPFNILKLNVGLYHPDLEKNIILSPDFDSYKSGEIDKFIGIQKDIILDPSIHIDKSYFFYKNYENQSNFGLSDSARQEDFPNLFFELNMYEGIINPLVAYLVPIIVISLLLFYILLSLRNISPREASYTRIDLLGQTGAIFLALVFSHNALRGILKVGTIAYLESYYIIAYGITFIVASSCILQNIKSVRSNIFLSLISPLYHNLVYLYWPLLLQLVLISTLLFFY